MVILFSIILVVLSFLGMEFVAWFTHKYIMHGFLWSWHHSHHKVHTHTLERNDLFAIVFSIPSITCIYIGVYYAELYWVLAIGIGIFLYGVFYLIFHDIIVHRRIPIRFKTQNKYMKRIMNAHYTHHKTHTKEGAEAFGFLYAPKKYNNQSLSSL
ncbi:MAG: sterol desaturase family protein [Chitinophagaceae bacterium]|nr:sterol desaturase family protein [Chitinophagaceae bacterium]